MTIEVSGLSIKKNENRHWGGLWDGWSIHGMGNLFVDPIMVSDWKSLSEFFEYFLNMPASKRLCSFTENEGSPRECHC